MTRKEQNKMLSDKIEANNAQYNLDRINAEISAYSSGDLPKYEYLTKKDLKYKPQSVTKIVRLAPPPPLFNVGCKFAYSFLVLAAWHGFFRLGTTLSQGKGGFWLTLTKPNVFLWTFLWKYSESQLFLSLIVSKLVNLGEEITLFKAANRSFPVNIKGSLVHRNILVMVSFI